MKIPRTDTSTLARVVDILAEGLDTEDGLAATALAEAAMRLREQHAELATLRAELERRPAVL